MSTVEERPASLRRRTVLGLAAGGALLASGCGRPASKPTPVADTAPATTASLTATTPFYVAHRGGGGDWPEMTAYAYEQASKVQGLKALEVSVCLSRDGVLVCSHDATTTRTTGVPYTIAAQDWATLSRLVVSAKDTTDPEQPGRPLARFDEVVERYVDRFVLFVEPKVAIAEAPLLARLRALATPQRLVWKQPLVAAGFVAAKEAGFTTWGYALEEPSYGRQLDRLAASPTIDMLGVPVGAGRPFVDGVQAAASRNGKKTIAWAIASQADRSRAIEFGAAGLMVSTVLETGPGPAAGSPPTS